VARGGGRFGLGAGVALLLHRLEPRLGLQGPAAEGRELLAQVADELLELDERCPDR
jgi:hypothetical protein